LTIKNNTFRWLDDRFHRLSTGYGVKTYRVLIVSAVIIFLATLLFNQPGALISTSTNTMEYIVSFTDSFWFSVNQFLPVEIPSGSEWQPSSNNWPHWGIKFKTFASLLSLIGWILVPIGILSISGLLKRRDKF